MTRTSAVQQARHFLLLSGLLFVPCWSLPLECRAQEHETRKVEGYITAVRPPNGFEVNGTLTTTTSATRYGAIGGQALGAGSFSQASIQMGVYVFVEESVDKSSKAATAVEILFRDDSDKNLHGFGLVDKVIASGSEPVFRADGYVIRINAGTELSFHGDLKALADIGTNSWVKYAGKRDNTGVLQAARAEFYSARTMKEKSDKKATELETEMLAYENPAGSVSKDSLLDANGRLVSLRTKVRYSDAGGWCGWHSVPADHALQERVRRVGAAILPLFQRQLAADDPQKIAFRFYAVDDPKMRTDIFCNVGLVLIPKQVVERLQNDDQLAALLADGVAFNLQVRSEKLAAEMWGLIGAGLAGDLAGAFVPGLDLAFDVAGGIAEHKIAVSLREQRDRMTLALMADAGFDPWQAPEAWRLVEPKHPANDPSTLKYPSRSGYQLGILGFQYKKTAESASAALPGKAPAELK